MPHDIDIAVGERLRTIRIARKISQTELGNAIGVTFQQVQKYEKSSNRISASKLWLMAQILEVDIGYFFQDMDGLKAKARPEFSEAAIKLAVLFDANPNKGFKRRLLEFVRAVDTASPE